MNVFPSTVVCPGDDPTVVHTWFAMLTFSYPGPEGISVWHVPFNVRNSLAIIDSKVHRIGCSKNLLISAVYIPENETMRPTFRYVIHLKPPTIVGLGSAKPVYRISASSITPAIVCAVAGSDTLAATARMQAFIVKDTQNRKRKNVKNWDAEV